MKFKLEAAHPGVMVFHIQEALGKADVAVVVETAKKLLTAGRGRIIVHFVPAAAKGEITPAALEAALAPHRQAAQKSGGDIRFAVDGTENSLDAQLKTYQVKAEVPASADSGEKELRLKQLTEENQRLSEKVKELTELARQPSTDAQLKAAVAHFRALVAETESAPAPAKPA